MKKQAYARGLLYAGLAQAFRKPEGPIRGKRGFARPGAAASGWRCGCHVRRPGFGPDSR